MRSVVLASASAALLLLAGCGGGGLDFSMFRGRLVATSFVGYQPAPGLYPGQPYVPLPMVFRDQALEFTFDKPLDDGIFGGFVDQGGAPLEMLGVAAAGVGGIAYFPFADQDAARASLQIRPNEANAQPYFPYIVGRHRDKPDTIVVDPRVAAGNPLGLTASFGFAQNKEYVFRIPEDNGFRFGGFAAEPFGAEAAELPIFIPPYMTQPELSRLFRTGIQFGPDPTPPEVLSISALSGAEGTPADPISEADPFVIVFSKPVTGESIDPLKNFVVRNIDVTTPQAFAGTIVPGSISPLTPGALIDSTWLFIPAAPYGPGVSPSEGYDVEVRIGTFGQPPSVPPILGIPVGISGTQFPLSNSLARTFRTTPCNGCQAALSIFESFDDAAKRDATFIQTFGPQQAGWNGGGAVGKLAGRFLSGSAAGTTQATLGTRIQFISNPLPPTTNPEGLFSPFDASLASSGGQCPGIPTGCNLGINPQGGSHILHLYEAVELGNVEDSLEQIEWSPVGGVVNGTTYPQYRIWCGVSSIAAPISGAGGSGLTSVFDSNYNLAPYQSGIPISPVCAAPTAVNPRKVSCGGPMNYVVPTTVTGFHPFPLLSPCFDYSRDNGLSGIGVNLLFEQNIEPGQQVPNFNRFRATSFTPVRRLIDAPLSLNPPGICPFNHGGTFDVYRARFTFVGLVAQARSLWYDTGVTDPNYLNFILSPSHVTQPAGTASTWILEGTDVTNPAPGTLGTSGVYINAAGVVNPAVLSSTIAGLRYFRFRVELRGNNVSNAIPAYGSVMMAYTP